MWSRSPFQHATEKLLYPLALIYKFGCNSHADSSKKVYFLLLLDPIFADNTDIKSFIYFFPYPTNFPLFFCFDIWTRLSLQRCWRVSEFNTFHSINLKLVFFLSVWFFFVCISIHLYHYLMPFIFFYKSTAVYFLKHPVIADVCRKKFWELFLYVLLWCAKLNSELCSNFILQANMHLEKQKFIEMLWIGCWFVWTFLSLHYHTTLNFSISFSIEKLESGIC